ncbi:YggT family protein [Mesorhizobium microcysteis]|uniref:YggT family protein n=2 Tax=Neoaquamicrobium microcysteis TaxID=2682781 RepID=A0A5D4GU56_9HYPH|nr:YggT family protein [Mesorhizobium microcysteis]
MAGIYERGRAPVKRHAPCVTSVPRRRPAAVCLPAFRLRHLPVHQPMATCRGSNGETGMLALIQTIVLALDLYWWIIIASAIFSWLYAFNVVNPRNQFVGTIGNFLYRITEPALRPIRRVMPDLGGIDISPIILLLLIFFVRQLILTTIAPALLS